MLYQFLPRLSDEEYAALEASIVEHGIQVPIILDENGSVIDGHHRKEIAERLGIEFPKRTKTGLSDADKRTLALTLNIDRRQLNREQKRALIADSLRADPELPNTTHARRTGVSDKTVQDVREKLESDSEIPNDTPRVNARGQERPASYKRTETTKVEETIDADPVTGEVIEEPARKPPVERRRSIVDDAYKTNRDLWAAVERLRAIRSDDRYTRNKADILAALQPSVDLAREVLANL